MSEAIDGMVKLCSETMDWEQDEDKVTAAHFFDLYLYIWSSVNCLQSLIDNMSRNQPS